MTLLETLRAHRGCLVRIKTDLYWYLGSGRQRGNDGVPGRVCLLLDADTHAPVIATVCRSHALQVPAALLLVDGQPCWIWVDESSLEIIDETC